MKSATERSPAQILRSRGVGARVGSLIGMGWMAYGLFGFSTTVQIFLGLTGMVVTVLLLIGSGRLIVLARSLPAPDFAERFANRRVLTLFWINFAVEIVLLNVALNLLKQPSLYLYWIPAISFIVGLHFLPMAYFFGVPVYRACGAAMMLTAAAVAVGIRLGAIPPQGFVVAEALVNAVILWGTAAWGIFVVARPTVRSSEPSLRSGG